MPKSLPQIRWLMGGGADARTSQENLLCAAGWWKDVLNGGLSPEREPELLFLIGPSGLAPEEVNCGELVCRGETEWGLRGDFKSEGESPFGLTVKYNSRVPGINLTPATPSPPLHISIHLEQQEEAD